MQSNLYEALGVEPSSDTPAIRAGLRAVLRRFWAAPRDASGDSEEAVRFVALAAAILTDPAQRRAYDDAAMPSQMQNPWRAMSPPNVPADGAISLGLDVNAALSVRENRRAEPGLLPTVSALARSLPEPSHWASAYVFAATALAFTLLVGTVFWVAIGNQMQLLTALGLAIVAAALSVGVASRVRSEAPDQSAPSLSRLSIVKWRRESSIFMGTPPPQQDTAWIFRLRLMELTRSAAGFTTLTNLGARVLGRSADYGLLALLALAVLSAIHWLVPQSAAVLSLLRSPLCFPTLIVLAGVVWDALWLSKYRITPGRWLVGAVVVSGVTETAYGDAPPGFRVITRRAWHHAVSAMALGIVPIALWFSKSRWTRLKHAEGSWEAQSDSVVLTRPTPLALRAAAAAIAVAALVLLFNQWVADAAVAKSWLSRTWQTASREVSELGTELKKSTPIIASVPSGSSGQPAPTEAAPAAPMADTKAAETPAVRAPQLIKPAPQPSAAAPSAEDAQARAVQERRARIDAISAQAARARQNGNYAGLQGACQRWTEDQPASAAAWRCLGLAKFQAGAGRDALPALRQALKLEPNDADVESAILRTLRP